VDGILASVNRQESADIKIHKRKTGISLQEHSKRMAVSNSEAAPACQLEAAR
jgi:hypothetical protein